MGKDIQKQEKVPDRITQILNQLTGLRFFNALDRATINPMVNTSYADELADLINKRAQERGLGKVALAGYSACAEDRKSRTGDIIQYMTITKPTYHGATTSIDSLVINLNNDATRNAVLEVIRELSEVIQAKVGAASVSSAMARV